jgi:hypothetical protein
VYVGAQYVFKTTDRGETWERISPDLTTNDPEKQKQSESGGLTTDNSTAENHTTIVCIAESAMDPDLVWAGTDDGNLQVTRDGGGNWVNVSGNIPGLPSHTWCSSVYPSRFEKGTAYATFDGHRNDDMNPYVFKTTDYGNTWTALADENITAYCYKILEDLVNPELLFLGTEFGLFISVDGGGSWAQFENGLPNVSVMDMVIHPREQDLVLGTHGRGIYIIDDITPLRQLTPEVIDSDFAFLKSRHAYPMSITGPLWSGWPGDDEYSAPNPVSAVPVTFYMKKRHIFGKMTIEVMDQQGKVLSELPSVSRKGINRVYWNPVMSPPRMPRTEAMVMGMDIGMFSQPSWPAGEYPVRIKKGKDVFETSVNVYRNPDSPHSDADRTLRRETIMKGYNLLEDLAYLDRITADILARTAEPEKLSGLKSSALKKLTAMNAELNEVRNRLAVRKYGDLRGDAELREEVGSLYSSILGYPGRPTNQQIRSMESMTGKVEAMETKMDDIMDRYLEGINTQFEKAGLEPLKIISREEFDAEKEK